MALLFVAYENKEMKNIFNSVYMETKCLVLYIAHNRICIIYIIEAWKWASIAPKQIKIMNNNS